MSLFFSQKRILLGPWNAFERDVARLFQHNGFENVQRVGGTGDKGADILASKDGKLYVIQCKYTTNSKTPTDVVDEVIAAGLYYSADHLVIALSRNPSASLSKRLNDEKENGLLIEVLSPQIMLDWCKNALDDSSNKKTLRQYQEECVETFISSLLETEKAQIVLATGLGKTLIMAETVRRLYNDKKIWGNSVLVLAHTVPLVDQLIQSFWPQLPKSIATHRLAAGEVPSYYDGVTFATIQTVLNKKNELPEFGLVLVDEAHHIGAESFRKVIEVLNPKMLGGVTATPWRGDGYDIDVLLGPARVKIGINDGLRNNFLSEVDYRILLDNLDWRQVQRASEHNYSLKELNKRLLIPIRDEKAAEIILRVFKNESRKQAVCYCPSGEHAKSFAGALRQFGFKSEAILHETPANERARLLGYFRKGNLNIVTVVDLFNEGVDVPDVDLIIFMRATHSRRIFVQQLGRGLRPSINKDKVVVLDFVSDLRRVAEIINLDNSIRGGAVERLGLGRQVLEFSDRSSGSFLREWMLDQASLILRENDPRLEVPRFNFPEIPHGGGVE